MPRPTPARDSASLDQFSAFAQRQAVAARNLVNTDELKIWLQELLASRFGSSAGPANEINPPPRQAACQRWIHSVARKWMIRQGQIESHEPSGQALAQSPAWIQQAVANGTPPQRLSLLHSERETLAGVLDWMRSDDGPALSSDWSRISVEQAISSEKAWIDAMAKAALKKDLDAADAAGTTLFTQSLAPSPDGRSGWRWVQVHSKDALDREGALMRHCVGSYADDVAADRKSIYSLRDPDNKPRLTLETQQGRIAQLKAFANQPCSPELFSRVAHFARAFESFCATKQWPLQVADEAEAAGIFIVPGFGLAVLGSPPLAEFSIRFAAELRKKNPDSIQALPTLAALGWNNLLQAALPHASIELKNKALVKAAGVGQLCSVKLLLPHSDPLANESQALSEAARKGRLAVVQALLPRSDPKANSSHALALAAGQGHLAVVQLLLPHSKPKAIGSQALRLAANKGHLAIAELLLPHSDPKANGSYALRSAASNGHLPLVELLLPLSPAADQATAQEAARRANSLEAVELIQAAIDAQNPSAPPLASVHTKLLHARFRHRPQAHCSTSPFKPS
jgi:hypothetical protein